MNSGWNWTLKVNVETKHHKEYEKKPLKTLKNTTIFGYVPIGRKKKFQDYKCRNASNH
jgi:hypothetical protein